MTHCAIPVESSRELNILRDPTRLTVALAGQPNVGKSTVFNMLTGLSQHVGNWPGKTIERKLGTYTQDGVTLTLIDLPGTYSLTANSVEEQIARAFLISERPVVVIAIVNAAALERSLYLVAELLALNLPMVLGLNMSDVAAQHGIHVEPHVLSAALGIRVVPLVAAKNQGIRELVTAAIELAAEPATWRPNRPEIRPEHAPVLATMQELVLPYAPPNYAPEWIALKLLEGDSEITALMQSALPPQTWSAVHDLLLRHEDAYLDIAGGRYEWISRMIRAAVIRPRAGAITRTNRIDRVATHPLGGALVLAGILGVVFWLTYSLALPISDWISIHLLGGLDRAAGRLLMGAPEWLSGLVSGGLIHGVGTVISFVPILIVFFAMLGILEDVGYLARGAYVTDRFMHLMGLHGKSFMPLFLGFGCNVPAVLGTRIIEERRARLLTILLTPLVPCTARLAVLTFLAPAFFGRGAVLVTWGLVMVNLALLAVAGILVNRLHFRGEQTAFIMELPLYHIPNARTVGLYIWSNTVEFLKKAGTLILLASIVVWALSSFPGGSIEESVLAVLGRWIEPIGRLMGFGDWRIMVALISSFFAKENTIATLGILYAVGSGSNLANVIAAELSSAARLAFLVVQMLFVPCLATVATIKQETGGWRWALISVGFMLLLSVGVGTAVYQIGRLLVG